MPLKAPEPKWDWPVIQALYLGGMALSDIVKIPRYAELSLSYLSKRASIGKWREMREKAQSEGAGLISLPLVERMQDAVNTHQSWLLDQLATERKVFQRRLKTGKNQTERLESLRRIDDMTRKLLGMDDMKPLTPDKRNLGILIAMQGQNAKVTITNGEVVMQQEPEKPATGREVAAEVRHLMKMVEVARQADELDAKEGARELVGAPGIREIRGPKFKSTSPEPSEGESLVDESSYLRTTIEAAGYETVDLTNKTPDEIETLINKQQE
jgi:hypothetical protein